MDYSIQQRTGQNTNVCLAENTARVRVGTAQTVPLTTTYVHMQLLPTTTIATSRYVEHTDISYLRKHDHDIHLDIIINSTDTYCAKARDSISIRSCTPADNIRPPPPLGRIHFKDRRMAALLSVPRGAAVTKRVSLCYIVFSNNAPEKMLIFAYFIVTPTRKVHRTPVALCL